jgi:hypothetical protein
MEVGRDRERQRENPWASYVRNLISGNYEQKLINI